MLAAETGSDMSQIKSDERIVFFPTAARLDDEGRSWIVPIHGWIFEPEEDDIFRRSALSQLRKALGLAAGPCTSTVFQRRAGLFLVDNERGKRVGIRMGRHQYTLPASGKDGHFVGSVRRLRGHPVLAQAAGHRMSPGEKRDFVAHYRARMADRHLRDTLGDRIRLRDPFVYLRGISWSAMGWVAYQTDFDGLRNPDTWATLQRYMDYRFIRSIFDPFLKM